MDAEQIALYRKLKEQGRLPIRVALTWRPDASRPTEELVEEILQISRQNQSTLESLRGAQQRELFAKFAASLGPPQGESLSKSLTSLIMANDIGDPSAKQALGHYLASLWASRQPPPEPGKPPSESPTGEKL